MARPKKPRSGNLTVFIVALVGRESNRDFELFAAYDHADARSRAIAYYSPMVDRPLRSNSVAIKSYPFNEVDHSRLLGLASENGFIGSYVDGKWTGPVVKLAAA